MPPAEWLSPNVVNDTTRLILLRGRQGFVCRPHSPTGRSLSIANPAHQTPPRVSHAAATALGMCSARGRRPTPSARRSKVRTAELSAERRPAPLTTAQGLTRPVHSGTAPVPVAQYTDVMRTELLKKAVIGAWVLSLGALAFSVTLTSVGAWTALVGLGILPPLIMLKMWNPPGPAQSMSESIRDAIR